MTNQIQQLLNNQLAIEKRIGYTFRDRALFTQAFIHRSYANEHRDIPHNEKLEFLGDSVLGLISSNFLFQTLAKETSEGDLSFLRSRLVDASACARYIQALELFPYAILGRGERMTEGRGKETIAADLFEALMGAIYLDGGLEAATDFWLNNFRDQINSILETPTGNWKAMLQDFCQKKYHATPDYKILEETGPDHQRHFVISVQIQDKEIGQGSGASKKAAQQNAALNALSKLQEV